MKIAMIEDELICEEYNRLLINRQAENRKYEISLSVYRSVDLSGDDYQKLLETDLIFINVDLKEEDGIKVAEKLRMLEYVNEIVLYGDQIKKALEGYKVNAFRYYMKPVKETEIAACMDHVQNIIAGAFFQYMFHGVTEKIRYKDIICFESMQHYIDIFTVRGNARMKGSLKEIQKQCPSFFIRCQRSYIVNRNHIIKKKGNKLVLTNNKEVEIAPQFLKEIFT